MRPDGSRYAETDVRYQVQRNKPQAVMAATLRKQRLRRRKSRQRRLRRRNRELKRRRLLLQRVPIEVWENVIDELQDNWWRLRACARVCRGWIARSRLHLRKWVILQRPDQVWRLAKLVRTGSWEVESCRTVWLRRTRTGYYSLRTLGLFAAMFAGKMPRLEELLVWGSDSWMEWKPGEMHADVFLHLSAFTSITRLILQNVRFPSVQTFGRLLSAFPSLATLECGWIEFKAHNLNVGALLRRPRKLATLDLGLLDLATLDDICRLLVGTEMASTLKEIKSWSIRLCDLNESGIPALISSAGASLLSLDLRLDGSRDEEPAVEMDQMDLSQLVNLQHARFDMMESAIDWVLWLCHQLASYPTSSTALRTLTLLIDVEHGADYADYAGLDATTFQQLDNALSTPPFMSLKEVRLECYSFGPWNTAVSEGFRQLLRARLPQLDARGILR